MEPFDQLAELFLPNIIVVHHFHAQNRIASRQNSRPNRLFDENLFKKLKKNGSGIVILVNLK